MEERELWHMPALLLAFMGLVCTGMGAAAPLAARVKVQMANGKCQWQTRVLTWLIAAATLVAAPAAAWAQSSHLLIVVGLAGDPEHGELFDKWAATLAGRRPNRLGVAKDR